MYRALSEKIKYDQFSLGGLGQGGGCCCGPVTCFNVAVNTYWCGNHVAPGLVTITVRAGSCPGGAVVATNTGDEHGAAGFYLPEGFYCVESATTAPGYYSVPTTLYVPATGTAGALVPLSPAAVVITDSATGADVLVYPYGTTPDGIAASQSNYRGTTSITSVASPCCPGGTIAAIYIFSCASPLCGGPSVTVVSSSQAPDAQTFACPAGGPPFPLSFDFCIANMSLDFPLSSSWPPPDDGSPCTSNYPSLTRPCGIASILYGAYSPGCSPAGELTLPVPAPTTVITVAQA